MNAKSELTTTQVDKATFSEDLVPVEGRSSKIIESENLRNRPDSEGQNDAHKSLANPALWMICGAFSFTLMGGMANALGSRCDWRIVAQSRTIFSFFAALTLAQISGAKLVLFRPRILWLRSIAGTLSLMSTFYALTHLPVADVLTLTNTYPLWIVLIGFLIWGETVEPSILMAIASALVGVVLIQQPHLEGNRIALAAALGAATFTAVAMMGLNRLGRIDPRAVVTHFSGVAALIMVPVLFLGHPVDWQAIADPITVALLLGVGITGTIGQIFLTKAYAAGSAPRVAVIGMSQVAMGLMFDILYRQKLPLPGSLLGMLLVVGPVMWVILQGKGRPKVAKLYGINPNQVLQNSCETFEMQTRAGCISGKESLSVPKSTSIVQGLKKPDPVGTSPS